MSKDYYVAICDDEICFIKRMKELLIRYSHKIQENFIIDIFPSGEVFLKDRGKMNRYDILFLDIEMEGTSGLQTAYEIRKYNRNIQIVFVADTMDYAQEGYKVDAIRYIMKHQLKDIFGECMNAVMEKIQQYPMIGRHSFLCGNCLVDVDEIIYIESNLHKVHFNMCRDYSGRKNLVIYDKLDSIENELSKYSFLRIHKSYLVNMKHIKKISGYVVYLFTGESLPASKSLYKGVQEKFSLYKESV